MHLPSAQDDRGAVYVMMVMERHIAEAFDSYVIFMSILSSIHLTPKNKQNCGHTGDEFFLFVRIYLSLCVLSGLSFVC